MDDESDRGQHIGRPATTTLTRLERGLADWLAAAWYFAGEAAALLADTLGILLSSAAIALRTSHLHGPRSGARG